MWEPNYVTVEQFKRYVGLNIGETDEDEFIELDIAAASRAIDKWCSNRPNGLGSFRQFGKTDTSVTRYYTPRWSIEQSRWVVEIDDLAESTGLAIGVDNDNSDVYSGILVDYILRPRDAIERGRPFTQISVGSSSTIQLYTWPDSVAVTSAHWGWSAIPEMIQRATLIQAHRFNKRRVAPFGIKGSPQKGTQQIVLDECDADVQAMITANNFVKLGWTM